MTNLTKLISEVQKCGRLSIAAFDQKTLVLGQTRSKELQSLCPDPEIVAHLNGALSRFTDSLVIVGACYYRAIDTLRSGEDFSTYQARLHLMQAVPNERALLHENLPCERAIRLIAEYEIKRNENQIKANDDAHTLR